MGIPGQLRFVSRVAGASLALISAVLLLSGCGGSTAPTAAAQHGQQTPGQSNADIAQEGARPGTGKIRVARIGTQSARHDRSTSKDDQSAYAPKALNPCKLVSLAEAQTITGGQVHSLVEAPLGPTCIYSGARSEITMSVDPMSVSQASGHMTHRQPVNVGSHRGYCGQLGTQMLFVPLAGGRVLHVTAPCGIAGQFATRALSRISA